MTTRTEAWEANDGTFHKTEREARLQELLNAVRDAIPKRPYPFPDVGSLMTTFDLDRILDLACMAGLVRRV